MPLQTVFLDAGGVILYPNWWRVSDALAKYGVAVTAEALIDRGPRGRLQLDDMKVIGGTTDATRGWLFFDLVLEHEVEEQPAARRVGGAANHLHVVELQPPPRTAVDQRFGGDGYAVLRQRVRYTPPVGIQDDAAGVEEHGLQGHTVFISMVRFRLKPEATGRKIASG